MSLLAAALLLVLVDTYTTWLQPVRGWLGSVATPFYWLADIPQRVGHWSDNNLVSREQLIHDNEGLRAENLILQRKLQRMAALAAENVRLRALLNSAEKIDDDVLVAELVGVSPDPLSHKVLVNRGGEHGAVPGQPVLDAHGLMGQVVAVSPWNSSVLLITDTTHALPVQVNRNGVRAIAEGTGDLQALRLRHVSPTTDIREGDLLVSSGLGGRFPVGYPVATVSSVTIDPGQSFAEVIARPAAQLNRSRYVLLVQQPPQALPDVP